MSKELKKNLDILEQHLDNLREIYGIKKIGVFGSVVYGRESRNSDIDILVEFRRPVGFFKFIELEDELSKILRRKVDLTTKRALKPVIKQSVLKDVVYV